MQPLIGVLALQGDFAAHRLAITAEGARAIEVRTAQDLASCDGLILPGGESTTMLRLLNVEGLFEALRLYGQQRPIYGTCAGVILLATQVSNPQQASLGLFDIHVERNAYGRQIDSHIATLDCAHGSLEAVFIRAPIIRSVGPGVNVVSVHRGTPVWVDDGRHMITTFHPELTRDRTAHRAFLARVRDTTGRS